MEEDLIKLLEDLYKDNENFKNSNIWLEDCFVNGVNSSISVIKKYFENIRFEEWLTNYSEIGNGCYWFDSSTIFTKEAMWDIFNQQFK